MPFPLTLWHQDLVPSLFCTAGLLLPRDCQGIHRHPAALINPSLPRKEISSCWSLMRREAAQKSHFPLQWAHFLSSTQRLRASEPEPRHGKADRDQPLCGASGDWRALLEIPARSTCRSGNSPGRCHTAPTAHLAAQGMIIPEQLADG